jgi:hypothetical protein
VGEWEEGELGAAEIHERGVCEGDGVYGLLEV